MDKLITYFQIVFPTEQRIQSLATNPQIIIDCINIYKDRTAIQILDKYPECASYIDYSTNTTPLIASCKHKYSNLALKLIDANQTNINQRDREGSNAVKYAIKNQMWSVFDELHRYNVILDYYDIYALCETLDERKLQSIFLKPYVQDLVKNNITTLLKICIKRDIAIEQLINENITQDTSLLTHAINNSSLANFKLLLKYGAKLDYIDPDGNTYLIVACKKYVSCVINFTQIYDSPDIEIILRILLDPEFISKYDVTKFNHQGSCALYLLIKYSAWYGFSGRNIYDKQTSAYDLIMPLFKITCEQNKKKQIYGALCQAIIGENKSLCYDFISVYNYDQIDETYKSEIDNLCSLKCGYDLQSFVAHAKKNIVNAQKQNHNNNIKNIINEINANRKIDSN